MDINQAARTLMTPTQDTRATDAAGAAAQAIGQGVQSLANAGDRAAGVVLDWKAKEVRATDEIALAQRDTVRAQHLAEVDAKIQGRPENEWVGVFDESQTDLDKKLSAYPISSGAAERATAEQIGWVGSQRARLQMQGTESAFQRGKTDVVTSIRRAVEERDYPTAMAKIQTGRAALVLDEEDAKGLEYEMVKGQRRDQEMALLSTDPKAYVAEMQEGRKTGKSDIFPWMSHEDFLRGDSLGRSQVSTMKSDTVDAIKSGIAGGKITSIEDIKATAGDSLDPDEVASLQPMLNKYRPVDWKVYGDIQTEVANYDPAKDTTGEEAVKLKFRYRSTLPDIQADELDRQLTDIRTSGKAESPGAREGISAINQQFELGFYGDFKDSKITETKKLQTYATASRTRAEKIDAYRAWIKDNPKATSAQISEYINGALTPERTINGASIMGQGKGNDRLDIGTGVFNPGMGNAYPMPFPVQRPSAVDAAKEKLQGGKPSASLGGVLKGKESVFDVAAARYGVDPALLKAIAMHETGNGTSKAAKQRNNPGGLMNPKNYDEIQSFDSLEDGIDAMARNLGRNYVGQGLTTIEAIQKKYAPVGASNDKYGLNKDWVGGVSKFYKQIKGEI